MMRHMEISNACAHQGPPWGGARRPNDIRIDMRSHRQKTIHRLFEIGLIGKLVDCGLEMVGLVVAFLRKHRWANPVPIVTFGSFLWAISCIDTPIRAPSGYWPSRCSIYS